MARGKVEPGSEIRRQAILTAALDCFTAKSFSETTMSDIQKRSGASVGSIYHHFDSKERLAAELYLEGLKSLHNALRQVLNATNQPEKGIKDLVQAYISWVRQNPDWGSYLFQGMSAQYLEVEGEKIREEGTQLRRDIWSWLEPHIKTGAIANLPRELYSPLMFGPTREYLQQWLAQRDEGKVGDVSQSLADAAWRVLATTRN